MRNPILVCKRKVDGTEGWSRQADLVDAHGDWLVTHSDPDRHLLLVARRSETFAPFTFLGFYNTMLPIAWELVFDPLGRFLGAKCDAAKPAILGGRMLTYVDLDLDVVVRAPAAGGPPGALPEVLARVAPGSYLVQDQEQFLERSPGYPRDLVRMAWEGVRLGRLAAETRAYPLDGTGERLLGMLWASEGPL